jgi:hypothetical protein
MATEGSRTEKCIRGHTCPHVTLLKNVGLNTFISGIPSCSSQEVRDGLCQATAALTSYQPHAQMPAQNQSHLWTTCWTAAAADLPICHRLPATHESNARTCLYVLADGCSRLPRPPRRISRLITRPSRRGSIGGLVTCSRWADTGLR